MTDSSTAVKAAPAISSLDQVRIVLVRSQHPGNIGAAARAMKNMGLRDLVLVQPRVFPHADAAAMAAGATDLLDECRVEDTLAAAVSDCVRVFAATARDRRAQWQVTEAGELGRRLQGIAGERVAVVFGPERTGLDNRDLDYCQEILTIDADPRYPAMNLAGAVQVISYALRQSLRPTDAAPKSTDRRRMPANRELEALHEQLQRMLTASDFFDERTNPTLGLRRLRTIFSRAELDHKELQMLRGILTGFERRMGQGG